MRVKHIFEQPFVAATGAAALVHSTWALGTLFAGQQPPEGWALVGWLAPALLIAFALDVGQIVTSAEIRRYGLTVTRGVTFIVFAGATYYLQWLYIAHHMPELQLAAGVRETWAGFATVMRDAAVWIIPALLPLSTLLYTFSGGRLEAAAPGGTTHLEPIRTAPAAVQPARVGMLNHQESSPALPEPEGSIEADAEGGYVARFGEWEKRYNALSSAQRGLAGFKGRWQQTQAVGGSLNGTSHQ